MTGERDLAERSHALDELDLSELEDFDSGEFVVDEAEDDAARAKRGRNSYIASVWRRNGFDVEGATPVERILAAHRMVQNVVNTFATDGFYRVAFDPNQPTARTGGKLVELTPAPLFDESITVERAVEVLTAIAAHEISHPRYGRNTRQAVLKVFGPKRAPLYISNILDDVRIERRFVEDYPGYADIFRPAAEYLMQKALEQDPEFGPSMDQLVNLCGLALRYHWMFEWDGELAVERDWWQSWASRWAHEDAPRRHVEAVREALKHVLEVKARRRLESEARDAERTAKLRALMGSAPKTEAQILGEAIGQLPVGIRKALRLSSEGRGGSEIAATLGVSERKVKLMLRSGRQAVARARAEAKTEAVTQAVTDSLLHPMPRQESQYREITRGEDGEIKISTASTSLFEFLRERGYNVTMKKSP